MLLDTNIVIEHLDAEQSIVAALAHYKEHGEELLISAVTVTEALSHEKLTPEEVVKIKAYLGTLHVFPLDAYIADVAGDFRRKYKLTAIDAMIVATAYVHHVPLATRDKKMRKVQEVLFVAI